jgi:type VII secretion-associated protein (TIGR03931 family)
MDAGPLTAHRAVVEAGPAGIRRLCCSTTRVNEEHAEAALEAIDDPVALVDGQPVLTGSLWRSVLQSLVGELHPSLAIIHPSWWSTARVAVLRRAATGVAADMALCQRSQLLATGATVVEIAERFVVITGAQKAAVRRCGAAGLVAENVARIAAARAARAVVIDAPTAVGGAAELGEAISELLRATSAELAVTVVGDVEFSALAVRLSAADDHRVRLGVPSRRTRRTLIPVVLVMCAAAVVALAGLSHRSPPTVAMPTTFLVEGRVALTVPAQWMTQRIVAGPGSARVQITSPSDPDAALHVTQSLVADATLSDTAETLKRAIDEAPNGVFIDFNPNGHSAGRPAVTYREVRAGHDVRWTVILDGPVRISIGCQSRRGEDAAVHDACDLAVRSAHALH